MVRLKKNTVVGLDMIENIVNVKNGKHVGLNTRIQLCITLLERFLMQNNTQ